MSKLKIKCPHCTYEYLLEIDREMKRTSPQNRKLHPMLNDISKQIKWMGKYRSVEDWKDLLTAAYKIAKENLDIVPCPENLDVPVVLGLHTSDMTTAEMADLITYVYSFGNGRGVEWSEESEVNNVKSS